MVINIAYYSVSVNLIMAKKNPTEKVGLFDRLFLNLAGERSAGWRNVEVQDNEFCGLRWL